MGFLENREQVVEKMVDVSDEAIEEAYHDVRNDETDTDWMVCGYTDNGKALELRGSGSGGLDEMAATFPEDQPMYGYLRVTVGVKALKKAKMSVHKASFKELVREFAIEMHYTEPQEVDAAEIRARVIASGGANYSQKY